MTWQGFCGELLSSPLEKKGTEAADATAMRALQEAGMAAARSLLAKNLTGPPYH